MKDRKASGYYISLLILCFCTLLVTGFLLLHQLDLLLSIVSNTIAICTFIVGSLLIYGGIKGYRQARKQEESAQGKNKSQVSSIVRLPSMPTFFEYRTGATSYAATDRGFEELRKARGGRKKIPLNRNIIEGIILLAPVVSA